MKNLDIEVNDQETRLTAEEIRVLKALCAGYMRKEIARRTQKSVSCVSRHIENIAKKLSAHSAAEIVAKAVALNIVHISIRITMLLLMCSSSTAKIVSNYTFEA